MTYEEILSRNVIIEADSREEAEDVVLDKVREEEIVLTADDLFEWNTYCEEELQLDCIFESMACLWFRADVLPQTGGVFWQIAEKTFVSESDLDALLSNSGFTGEWGKHAWLLWADGYTCEQLDNMTIAQIEDVYSKHQFKNIQRIVLDANGKPGAVYEFID